MLISIIPTPRTFKNSAANSELEANLGYTYPDFKINNNNKVDIKWPTLDYYAGIKREREINSHMPHLLKI